MRFRNSRLFKVLTVFVLVNFLVEIFFPLGAYALTSGPKQPEFSTFTPVATTDMVNLFTGDFNYNIPVIEIPGVDGGGYALSLSYNSGVTSEQEASWVGLGWTLNPGSINRNLRGFPDESDGVQVKYFNKTRPNWTGTVAETVGLEFFGVDEIDTKQVRTEYFGGAKFTNSLRFNNHYGYQKDLGIGLNAKGIASLRINLNNDGVTFSPHLSPIKILYKPKKKAERNAEATPELKEESNNESEEIKKGTFKHAFLSGVKSRIGAPTVSVGGLINSAYGLYVQSENVKATNISEYRGKSFNYSASLQANPTPTPVGVEFGIQGGFSFNYNKYLSTRNTYGYLNSRNAGDFGIMDYYVEKGSAFDKRDLFIGMPFSNADVFSAAGEGLSGGFRAYNTQIGHFRPNEVSSTTKISQIGVEFMAGADVGVGLDLGIGRQKVKIQKWGNYDNFSSGSVFRFNQDQGGKIEYNSSHGLEKANVKLNIPIPGIMAAEAEAPESSADRSADHKLLDSESHSASFIQEKYLGDDLSGFDITNEGGITYHYGENVKVRNETSLSVNVPRGTFVRNRHLAFTPLKLTKSSNFYDVAGLEEDHHRSVLGEIRNEDYSSNFLLTAITDPNYVDVDGNNQPSQSDFGGWTSFSYRTKYGGAGNWYRYRLPYAGLLYNQNSISDTQDDLGSVSTGEKEVKYLEKIETKTHVAYFVTNESDFTNLFDAPYLKGSAVDNADLERKDGLGAVDLDIANELDPAATDASPKGNAKLEYLEKIVLFAKQPDGTPTYDKPLKVVRLEYDYSLVPNVPNNIDATFNYFGSTSASSEQTGKLTLKKLWFEYNGTAPAKISPYKFEYNYPSSTDFLTGQEYFQEYELLPEAIQNIPYSPDLMDPWGYPMANAEQNKQKGDYWVDQSACLQPNFYTEVFDPAAWQLKQVSLPSGGKINVQYEQKDYTKVQDRDAMAMASLTGAGEEDGYNNDQTYSINVEDLGADPTDMTQVNALLVKIQDHFTASKEKIYFKFLYALKNNGASLDDCRSEYISGYANFKSATTAVVDGKNVINITLASSGADRSPIPRQACYELVSNQRAGKLMSNDCVENLHERTFEQAFVNQANKSQSGDAFTGLIGVTTALMLSMRANPLLPFYVPPIKPLFCKSIEPQQSYFKLPMLTAKKGGGARVKRLLFYDDGLETGDPSLFGTIYRYEKEDGTSSGVATNEPGAAREENPIVTFMPKDNQDWFSRITVGEDKEQSEGPLGESILPGASIGHSRVVVENINNSDHGNGYTVHQFYTVENYPFDYSYNAISDVTKRGVKRTGLQTRTDNLRIPAGLFNYETSKSFAAQGFRFLMNNMHGANKAVSNFSGEYADGIANDYLVSQQQYNYFEPGEKVRMFRWNDGAQNFEEYLDLPGTEMEMAFESKKVSDRTIDFNVEMDLSVAFFPPVFITVVPSLSYRDQILATHATTKVIRYPLMIKSMTSYQDGIFNTEEYLAFNEHTGKPVLTRNTDGFHDLNLAGSATPHDGSIYQLTIPASWVYPEMGRKSEDASAANRLGEQTAAFTTYGIEPDPTWFTSPTNVLSASVQTYDNNWFASVPAKLDDEYNLSSLSTSATTDLGNVMRPKASFLYKADNLVASNAKDKIYGTGYFDMGGQFDWAADKSDADQADPNWIKSSEVLYYSPNGAAVEERDVLDIHSAAVFKSSSNHHLPAMVAANAEYSSIAFQDFEYTADPVSVAHSGSRAHALVLGEDVITGLESNDHLLDQGGIFMGWFYFPEAEPTDMELEINASRIPLQRVAKTGEWVLLEARIAGATLPSAETPFSVKIQKTDNTLAQAAYIDDIRFQPFDSEGNCYVYDTRSLRLLTEFDDQHFGVYYQYNDEGQLISRSVETERGLKTVTETHYNLPKESK